jgi:hypothetical protein
MTFNNKTELRSTVKHSPTGEKALWCRVITETLYKARMGELAAINFFKYTDGHFSRLCFLLGLDEAAIRERVLAEVTLRANKRAATPIVIPAPAHFPKWE